MRDFAVLNVVVVVVTMKVLWVVFGVVCMSLFVEVFAKCSIFQSATPTIIRLKLETDDEGKKMGVASAQR